MEYDFYDGTPPHVDTDTSLNAAEEIRGSAGILREKVFNLIAARGPYGCTDDEVEVLLGMRHQTVSARRRELVLANRVIDSGIRRTTRSGRTAIVWLLSKDELIQ